MTPLAIVALAIVASPLAPPRPASADAFVICDADCRIDGGPPIHFEGDRVFDFELGIAAEAGESLEIRTEGSIYVYTPSPLAADSLDLRAGEGEQDSTIQGDRGDIALYADPEDVITAIAVFGHGSISIDHPAATPQIVDELAQAPVLTIEYLDPNGLPRTINVEVSELLGETALEDPPLSVFEAVGDVYLEFTGAEVANIVLEADGALWFSNASIPLPEPSGGALVACLVLAYLRRR